MQSMCRAAMHGSAQRIARTRHMATLYGLILHCVASLAPAQNARHIGCKERERRNEACLPPRAT